VETAAVETAAAGVAAAAVSMVKRVRAAVRFHDSVEVRSNCCELSCAVKVNPIRESRVNFPSLRRRATLTGRQPAAHAPSTCQGGSALATPSRAPRQPAIQSA